MSSGAFQLSRYAADYGVGTNIHPIKVQPETLALSITIGAGAVVNTPPAGATTIPISAKISSGKRSFGLIPSTIRVKFSGAPPTGYSVGGSIVLPALNKPIRAATKGAVGTYLGAAIVVVGVSPERVS